MKINRNNYEIFLVDYLDGKLTPEKEAMLMVFLHENPILPMKLMVFKNLG
ncbi:MAG: hypothetical protein H6537_02720 [Bacteroidales bacterium]|nr:hypothetical protein [Bacteroidales bacterium]